MKLKTVSLRNFRRFEDATIDFEENETVFVGPNNSGKTSATAAFRVFLGPQRLSLFDFSVSRIADIDLFGAGEEPEEDIPYPSLPAIEMDLWFDVDETVEWGRVSPLLVDIDAPIEEVGIRLSLNAKDAHALKQDYSSDAGGLGANSLSHFLSLGDNLSRYFTHSYYSLTKGDAGKSSVHVELPAEIGKRTLHSLIRVDFVDAQRNIDDIEVGRSNRLSAAFSEFYRRNLKQAEASEKANLIIDENNDRLTEHYATHFQPLLDVIKGLGVPSINDRHLKLKSSIRPEVALKGSTDLLYVDPTSDHELPEAYNGLGFKNLIFMAIQVIDFHLDWIRMEVSRPLCQLIFIEEPEVHLHAQVQQTFIANIWRIIREATESEKEPDMVPQIGISTHSSHIVDTAEFDKIRYFRRCVLDAEAENPPSTLNATKVLSLRDFSSINQSGSTDEGGAPASNCFLRQYLKLTHCDLFFADAAILVEGAAEKLLLPEMIKRCAPSLGSDYLTILEIGGAHSHRLEPLMKFLGIPYLVITDIDSVNPKDRRKTCRADTLKAVTCNNTLQHFFKKKTIKDLVALRTEEQEVEGGKCFIAFQKPTPVDGYGKKATMHGRTLEETFVYDNLPLFRDGTLDCGVPVPRGDDRVSDYEAIYEYVRSPSLKKTSFALDVVSSGSDWSVPTYISDGLKWLESHLHSADQE